MCKERGCSGVVWGDTEGVDSSFSITGAVFAQPGLSLKELF